MNKKAAANILIVDDNLKNIQVLGNTLHSSGYLISVAKSGGQALQLIEKNLPDLILLDVMMPDMDGYETCQHLKKTPSSSSIPVIFLTAKTETEDLIKGFKSGGVDYITKPFNREELLIRVKTHLELTKSREVILNQSNQLKQLNAAKDKLFSVVSHDLRGPIGTLEAALISAKEDPEFLSEHINDLIEMTSATKQLMENLLNWSKSQQDFISFNPTKLNLEHLIVQTIKVFQPKAQQKNISLFWENPRTIAAFGDKEMIYTVLRNLISNALKFTKENGLIKLMVNSTADQVEISIQDNGIGISEENIKQIMNKNSFHTTFGTKGEKGSGLGLNLCREFIDNNKGEFHIESSPGIGSKISFTLPIWASTPTMANK